MATTPPGGGGPPADGDGREGQLGRPRPDPGPAGPWPAPPFRPGGWGPAGSPPGGGAHPWLWRSTPAGNAGGQPGGGGKPPAGGRPRRVRSGSFRPKTGQRIGVDSRSGGEELDPAARRRVRRDMLLGRRSRAPRRRRQTALRVVLLFVGLLSALGFAGITSLVVGYNVYLAQVPDASSVASMEPPLDTNVYASDGTLIDIIHPAGYYHLHATYDQISRYLIEATVDIEDRHYWTEGSLDVPRIVQAGVGYLRHQSAGGASTITEQLAKISFLQDNGSLQYKVKEVILGNELAGEFTKQQILEMYLNRIPYGEQALGIQSAAEIFFHEPASQLDLAQSALLAGLPQAPTAYNPVNDRTATQTVNPLAKQRQGAVLQAMVNNGSITQAQADAAFKEKLTVYTLAQYDPRYYMGSALPISFLDYLTNYYLPATFGDSYANPGGWDIYTTLNLKDQALADQTVSSVVNGNQYWFESRAGDGSLVSLDPQNGEILAMTGSADYGSALWGQDNMAILPRQPGSTMKLFTYSALLATRQYTVLTPISNYAINLNGWTPKNYEGTLGGYCILEYCLGNSMNVPAVRAEYAVGVQPAASLAESMGATLYNGSSTYFPPADLWSFTLGSLQVSPLDLGDAAAAVADMGIAHAPAPVLKITDATTGTTVWSYDPNAAARRVLPDNVAFVMNMVLSNDAYRQPDFGYGDRLTLPDRPVDAKTGTSGAGNTNYDNFTVGWTPSVLTITWVGDPVCEGCPGHTLTPGVTSGLTGAAPIWQTYMKGVTAGTPVQWYTPPSDVYESGGNWFLPGTGPDSSFGNGAPICQPNCVPLYGYTGGSGGGGFLSNPTPTPTPAPTPPPTPTPGPGPGGGPSPGG